MFVAIAGLVVAVLMIAFQLVTGTGFLGLDHMVKRDKSPAQFWFLMGLECLALVVGVLAFAAFELG
ncbi:MAG: hypothetical protein ACE5KM_01835 [Planctomycetaceae bacterium]